MINVLWNIVRCAGLVALALAAMSACILMVYGIIISIKQAREEFKK